MCKLSKFTTKSGPALAVAGCLLILTFCVSAAVIPVGIPSWHRSVIKDTVVPTGKAADTLSPAARSAKLPADTGLLKNPPDSVMKVDSIRMSKDSVDAIVKYHADDSGVLIIATKDLFLYGKAKTDYKDLQLEAATIQYDQQSKTVRAYGATDSTGDIATKPQFTQGELKTISDSIFFNLETQKAYTKNTFFQEGEIL